MRALTLAPMAGIVCWCKENLAETRIPERSGINPRRFHRSNAANMKRIARIFPIASAVLSSKFRIRNSC